MWCVGNLKARACPSRATSSQPLLMKSCMSWRWYSRGFFGGFLLLGSTPGPGRVDVLFQFGVHRVDEVTRIWGLWRPSSLTRLPSCRPFEWVRRWDFFNGVVCTHAAIYPPWGIPLPGSWGAPPDDFNFEAAIIAVCPQSLFVSIHLLLIEVDFGVSWYNPWSDRGRRLAVRGFYHLFLLWLVGDKGLFWP